MKRQVKASSALITVANRKVVRPIASVGVFAVAILLLVGILGANGAWAQGSPEVSFPITVSTDSGISQELSLGVDSSATAGIDSSFGETEQPPLPPTGVFDARLIDNDIPSSGLGEGVLVDIREGSASFIGTKMHELRVQPDDQATEFVIDWDLPVGVTGQLTDVVTDGELVDVSMNGDDSYTLTNLDVRKIMVRMDYDEPNVAPEASADSFQTTEGRKLEVGSSNGVLANDADQNGDQLTASIASDPSNGTLSFQEDGSFSYAPAAGFNGEDSFTYVADDGRGGTDQATVNIDVEPRSAPAASFPITVTSDTSSQELILGLDPDATSGIDPQLGEQEQPPMPPSGIFDARLVDDDVPGTFGEGLIRDLRNGTTSYTGFKEYEIEYQPSQGATETTISWNLPQSVTAQLTDVVNNGNEVSERMAGDDSTTITNLNIRKLSVALNYGPPVANQDRYSTIKDSTLGVSQPSNGVLANDERPDGDSLGAQLVTDVSNGDLTLNADGTFEYVLQPDSADTHVVADSFEYAASDRNPGAPQRDSAWVYLTIQPETVQFSISRSFGDASGFGDYRLVALPGQSSLPLSGTLNGEPGTEWQAYWDNGTSSDFLIRFDDTGTFDFQAGRGFWLTSLQEWSAEDNLSTVSLDGDTSATIPLNDGWTIISNPFGKSVPWGSVDRINDADLQPLWEFGGSFDSTDTFASAREGQAYYFFNDTGQSSLEIPYPGALETRDIAKTRDPTTSLLALSAMPADTDGPTSTVRMGIVEKEDAKTAVIAPPSRFSSVSLRITSPSSKSGGANGVEETLQREQLLMTSQRVVDGRGQTFRLRLKSEVKGPVRLVAEDLDAIDTDAVALLHPKTGETYDLRQEETVVIEPDGETAVLKLTAGSEDYVKDQASEVLPKEVTLTAFPNPVRQQGTLEYGLPEASEVTLRVYDVLGRQVATLEQGRRQAGRHTVHLETDGLASGVYFGRLKTEDRTLTQKITVVR